MAFFSESAGASHLLKLERVLFFGFSADQRAPDGRDNLLVIICTKIQSADVLKGLSGPSLVCGRENRNGHRQRQSSAALDPASAVHAHLQTVRRNENEESCFCPFGPLAQVSL